jgi:soluble lytic murein transglycosylase-like protein
LKQAFLAAKYLRKCYETFRDWDLAVQAYHLGIPYVKRGRRAYKYLQRVKEFSERMIWN